MERTVENKKIVDKNNTKERILNVALDLFSDNGYEAVSVSQIAEKLNITKGALYKHYKNKKDIFDSIILKMEEQDAIRAAEYNVPIQLPIDNKENVTYNNLVSFCLAQFEYWTQNEFASKFRKMLVVHQYKSIEMQSLYQNYLSKGQLDYVKNIFKSMNIENAEKKAVVFFAPIFLYYSLFDELKDKKRNKELINNLESYFNEFNLEE